MTTLPSSDHLVRRLWPTDLPLFRAHLLRLDPQTRHDRFGLFVSDDFLTHYAERCFGLGAITYGYFDDGEIRGAGELRTFAAGLPVAPDSAEAAFSVETDWRQRGVGTDLMARIVRAACNRGVGKVSIFCLAHNRAMLRLAKKFEAELKFETDDVTGRLVARTPSAASLWDEFVDDSLSLAAAMLALQTRLSPLGAQGA